MKKIGLLAVASLFAIATVHATLLRETFATDPSLDGWQEFGDTNLFLWDSTNSVLHVTWDSTQPNSYFYHPLDRTYTQDDGFCVLFNLKLDDATNYNFGMELAIGLLHLTDATNSDFSRADEPSPNVCEFDYYPTYVDPSNGKVYPDSEDATLIDSTNNYYFAFDTNTLLPGITYRIALVHEPGAETVTANIFTNGQLFSAMSLTYPGVEGTFQVDMLSVTSYADDGFGDSILAHGSVSNLAFASPLPVGLIQTPAAGQVQFCSDTNWLYALRQSPDFQTWTPAAVPRFGNGTNLLLQATNVPAGPVFYQVNAYLP